MRGLVGPGSAAPHPPISFHPRFAESWVSPGLLCKLHRHILSPLFCLGPFWAAPGLREPPCEKGDSLYRRGGPRPPVWAGGREEGRAAEHRVGGRARLPSSPAPLQLCECLAGASALCASVSLLINGESRTYPAGSCVEAVNLFHNLMPIRPLAQCRVTDWEKTCLQEITSVNLAELPRKPCQDPELSASGVGLGEPSRP